MPYSTKAEVKDKTVDKAVTQAGWVDADVDERILESDRVIDARLRAMGYPAPFATTPPLVNTLSIYHSRYAILRDIFTGNAPSRASLGTTQDERDYLGRFEKLLEQLFDGDALLLDAVGAIIPRNSESTQIKSVSDGNAIPRALHMGQPEDQNISEEYHSDETLGND